MKLSTPQKIFLVISCFIVSVIGFMVKLPPVFRHADKELHALFYFLAAALLNLLFTGTKILRHILVFAVLFGMGVLIEYAQEYSNKLLHKTIHGRFDPEDIKANLMGLVSFSILWLIWLAGRLLYRRSRMKAG